MEHLALYRKWRPQKFSELVGQEHIARTLLNALRYNRLAHAYLFCGPRGTGKTSTARLLAKALNCMACQAGEPCNQCQSCQEITAGHSLDVIEMDAASHRGIDNARELREQVRFSASGGRYRVFIIDEFHMLTHEAFNALLKTLEEPPANVVFVLATTEPHKVLQTIVSRCQRFDFQRIALPRLIQHLQHIAQAEHIGISQQVIQAIARKAAGGLRDALSLLDQVHALSRPGETLPDALVYQVLGLIDEDALLKLTQTLFQGDVENLLKTLQLLLEKGHDALHIIQELLQILRHLALAELSTARMEELGVPSHLLETLQTLRQDLSHAHIIAVIEQLVQTADRLHKVTQPEIWLEVDLLRICLNSESTLFQRIERLELKINNILDLYPEINKKNKNILKKEYYSNIISSQSLVAQPSTPSPSVHNASIPQSLVTEPSTVSSHEPPQEFFKDSSASESTVTNVEPAVKNAASESIQSKSISELELKQLWQRFLTLIIEHQSPLYGWMRNGRLIHVDANHGTWHVLFNSRTHKEQVERSLKSGRIHSLLEEVMGSPYQMLIELTEVRDSDPSTSVLPEISSQLESVSSSSAHVQTTPQPITSLPLPPPPSQPIPLAQASPQENTHNTPFSITKQPEETVMPLPITEHNLQSLECLETIAELFKGKVIHQEN